jgi:hypothetical protein
VRSSVPPLALVVVAAVAATVAAASPGSGEAELDTVRAQYAALRTLRTSVAEQPEAGRELRALLGDAEESFRASFAAVEFDACVRAYEYFLLALPGDAEARSVRASLLPRALLAAGDPAVGGPRLTQLVSRVDAARRSEVLGYLGALHAVGADFEAARAAYARAADEVEHAVIPESWLDAERGITARVLRRRRREKIEHCAARIGGDAPVLTPRAAAGGSPSSVRQKPGRVLVLNVFPFTDTGSRDLLRDLDALARRGPRDRVQVVSVTWCAAPELGDDELARKYAPKILMPADPADPGGEPVAVGREKLVKLLRLFHKRMELRHPLTLVDPDGLGDWFGEQRHVVIVVDPERRVRHVGSHPDGAALRGVVEAVLRADRAD